MRYPRPDFRDPSVKTRRVKALFATEENDVPVFDTPIPSKENFIRAAKRQDPLWVPAALTDLQSLLTHDIAGNCPRGMQMHSDLKRPATEDYLFQDWFGTSWTWVRSAGGAMLTPGTQLLGSILDWEKEVVWPDLSEWGFEEKAGQFMKEAYDPLKVMHYDFGRGVTERLVSLMGGYTESMTALAEEPEAVKDFFEAYTDFMILFFDKVSSLYPLDMVTLHDDWGTERDTFFSERMMEELVYGPTKRFIDHIKSKDILFELHACGNITRFVPYMVEMGADFLQIQRRAVDIPTLKEKYGDRVGFNAPLEGIVFGQPCSDEDVLSAVRKTVDIYAKGGGCYVGIHLPEPEQIWGAVSELYCYSREYYEEVGI
jgi:hypothetical protein